MTHFPTLTNNRNRHMALCAYEVASMPTRPRFRHLRQYLWAVLPSLVGYGFLLLALFAFLGALVEQGAL